MAIAFPRSLAAFQSILPIQEAQFRLQRNDAVSGLGSGHLLQAELASPLWRVEVVLASMDFAEASRAEAALNALDGARGWVLFYDPKRAAPIADLKGLLLGASAPVINGWTSTAISFSGLPAGYVLSAGDKVSFVRTNGGQSLHEISETVTANGAGTTPAAEVRPPPRAGTAAGLAVTLLKAAGGFRLEPGSFEPGTAGRGRVRGMRFSLVEKI